MRKREAYVRRVQPEVASSAGCQDDECDHAKVRPHRVKQQATSEERSELVKVSHVAE